MSTTTIANRPIETNEAIDRLTEALKQKPSDPAAPVSLQLPGCRAFSKGVRDVFRGACRGDGISAQNISDRSTTLLSFFFLIAADKKDSNETATKGGLTR